MAILDDLRALSEHLSPSFRVGADEALNVISALVQVAEHGQPLLDAAVKGAQEVADFYHQVAVKQAQQDGTEIPRSGAPVTAAPANPVGPAATPSQIDALLKQVQALSAAVANQNRSTEVEVGPSDTESGEETPPAKPSGLAGLFGGHGS